MAALRVEILSLGDELLRGIVHESNAHWLAGRLGERGVTPDRVTMLPDDPATVADEIRAAVARGAGLVVTHGGLGPTFDDRTRDALAAAAGVPRAPDPAATRIVADRYRALHAAGSADDPGLTPTRAAMASLPAGATALDNQVGAAPGIILRVGSATVVALPGVPAELRWIWDNPLRPTLDALLGPGGAAEDTIVLASNDESVIADAITSVQAAHPETYVKSRAAGFGSDDRIRVTVSARARSEPDARALVASAIRDLVAALGPLGPGGTQ